MASPVVFPFKATGAKDVENAFKSIASSAEKSSKATIKSIDAQEKAIDKLTKKVSKSASEMEKDRVKSAKTATDQVLQEYEKQAKAAEKLADRMDKAFEKVKNKNKGGTGIGGTAIGTFLGGMASKGASAAIGAVTDAITQATRESIKLDEMANRISISARGYGQKAVDKNALRKSFEQTAMNTPGISAEEVAAGTGAFVSKTGRLDVAQQMQDTFATAASATGGKVEDIATAAADLFEKFDVKSVDAMRESFAKLIFQGKEGAFEVKDMASQFAKLASAAKSFDIGKGEVAIANLGGLTQIARRATGSPEQAATAVESMFSNLTKNAGTLKQSGVNVFNKNGSSRNIQDILVDTIVGVGKGDIAKKKAGLQQIFGEQGIRAINPLIGTFQEAFLAKKGAGGSEQEALAAATKALREEFEKTINVGASWKEVQIDAAAAQATSSAQITAAWEKAKSGFADKVIPTLTEVIPKLVDPLVAAFGLIADAAGGVSDTLKLLGVVKRTDEKPVESLQKEAQDAAEEAAKNSKEYDEAIATKEKKGLEISDKERTMSDRLALTAANKKEAARIESLSTLGERVKARGYISDTAFAEQYGSVQGLISDDTGKDVAEKIRKGELSPDDEKTLQNKETKDQTVLRKQYEEQQAYQKQQNEASTKQVQAADALIKAGGSLERAAGSLNGGGSGNGDNGGGAGGAGPGSNAPHD